MFINEKLNFIRKIMASFWGCDKDEVYIKLLNDDNNIFTVRAICPYLPEEKVSFLFPNDEDIQEYLNNFPFNTKEDIFLLVFNLLSISILTNSPLYKTKFRRKINC